MPYQIYNDYSRKISTPLHVVVATNNHNYIKYDKKFFQLILQLIKELEMPFITIKLINTSEFYMGFENIREEKYKLIQCEMSGRNQWERDINKKRREVLDAVLANENIKLVYFDGAGLDIHKENSKTSALYNLLEVIKGIDDVDFEIIISDNMRPKIPEKVIKGINGIMVNGNPLVKKEAAWCMCPYNRTNLVEACIDCGWFNAAANDGKHRVDDKGRFKYEYTTDNQKSKLDALKKAYNADPSLYIKWLNNATKAENFVLDDVEKGKKEARRFLKRIEERGIETLTKGDINKFGRGKLRDLCIEMKTWRAVFDIDKSPVRNSVMAVAVGLNLDWNEFRQLMKIKGYLITEHIRLVDATVIYYLNNRTEKNKYEYTVSNINATLAGMGSTEFLGKKESEDK